MTQLKAIYGGIEFVVARLFDALVEHGLEVELFCAMGAPAGMTLQRPKRAWNRVRRA